MPSIRIYKNENDKPYFLTFTVRNWYHIFDRHNRWRILSESIKYCQKNKGLKVFAYVFMLNHIHMIAKAVNLEKVIGDFKKYTSKELMKNLLATDPNLAKLFTPKNGKLKIWQETNYPQLIETEKFFLIKFNYIRNNPVKKEYVLKPEYWKWSSVNPESEIKTDAFF